MFSIKTFFVSCFVDEYKENPPMKIRKMSISKIVHPPMTLELEHPTMFLAQQSAHRRLCLILCVCSNIRVQGFLLQAEGPGCDKENMLMH